MSFWDLVYFSWFGFIGLAVFSVFGAAFYDSAAKKRRLKAQEMPISADVDMMPEEPADMSEEMSADEPLEAAAPEGELPPADEEPLEELDFGS